MSSNTPKGKMSGSQYGKEDDPIDETLKKIKTTYDKSKERKRSITGELLNTVEKYSLKAPAEVKVVNDPVHGHIELHPLLVKIIDTPQFQRLRNIKQLGAGYWVYPGASHNRFEHSIGVAYLAGCLVKSLQEKQPELLISNRDILCVQIAGLCHDMGHGPFSHLFDRLFIPKVRPDINWKHEQASCDMFDQLVQDKELGLQEEMKSYGLKMENDLTFIKELIKGVDTSEGSKWERTGRGEQKSFLYEIVSNERNRIDVDKWDYFARDCHHLGISKSFDHQRLLKFARVCEVEIKDSDSVPKRNRRLSICYRDKEANNIYDMFRTRYTLHRQAYQHKTVNVIELMITEALVKADAHFQFSKAIDNMDEYTKLTDNVLKKMLEFDGTRETVKKIHKRDLPKFLGEAKLKNDDFSTVKNNWKKAVEKQSQLRAEDFVHDEVHIDHGMKDKNPVGHVYFYRKRNPSAVFPMTDQMFLPKTFDERLLRVYYKGQMETIEVAQRFFDSWHSAYVEKNEDAGAV